MEMSHRIPLNNLYRIRYVQMVVIQLAVQEKIHSFKNIITVCSLQLSHSSHVILQIRPPRPETQKGGKHLL